MLVPGMPCRILLLMLTLSLNPGWSQQESPECSALHTRLNAFLAKYNPYRSDGPRATLKTVEDELGKPRLEWGTSPGKTKAVYALEGCVGRVFIDDKGIAWMTNFGTVPIVPTPEMAALEQLQGVEKKILELKIQLEGLDALKLALVRQGAELPPTPPEALPQNPGSGAIGDADSLYGASRFDEAAHAYTNVLAASPTNPKAILRRAYCYHKLRRFKEAIQDYSESIRLAPTPAAYQNRAIAYLGMGQAEEALADLEHAKTAGATPASTDSIPASTDSASATGSSVPGTGGPVHVRGYTRKDGTYVAPHTRSAPRRR
jgi:tetratricopeptide (TPR) repeat protein